MKNLYLIDFDGTLTKEDSTRSFLREISNTYQYFMYYYLYPLKYIISYYFLRGDSYTIKKYRFYYFTSKISATDIKQKLERWDKHIDSILLDGAIEFIRKLKGNPDNEVYIVSAGISIILNGWTEREGVGLITNLFNASFTCPHNVFEHEYDCDRVGKVLRIRSEIDIDQYNRIIAYGDTPNDFDMFMLSDKFIYRSLEIA
jgi:phosphatidylglycerophosphatase C